jgi:ribosomal protein S2
MCSDNQQCDGIVYGIPFNVDGRKCVGIAVVKILS